MSRNRKDNKGRVLNTGESQRENGSYMYRYTVNKKRHYIYAPTLKELREKEKDVNKNLYNGFDIQSGNITLKQQVKKSLEIRKNALDNDTYYCYLGYYRSMEDDDIFQRKIKDLKKSDFKNWCVEKQVGGLKKSTISKYLGNVIAPAMDMAVDDYILPNNPARIKLSEILQDDSKKVRPLTDDEIVYILRFLDADRHYTSLKPYIILAIETGMRVSELCGLTEDDLDFEKREIHITHQLVRHTDRTYGVKTPKTEAGIRTVPMTDAAKEQLEFLIEDSRQYPDIEIDGYHRFIVRSTRGDLTDHDNLNKRYKNVTKMVDKMYGTNLSDTTWHSLRHTFATKLSGKGCYVKALQYMMGHSKSDTTLNIYAHANQKDAFNEARRLGMIE